jgi:hypothetical protein
MSPSLQRDPREALLQAAVSGPERAAQGWAEWTAGREIDQVNWDELRLLGAIARRSEELGVGPAERPRLEGIRRFIWAGTQMKIAAALPVLRSLAERKIPFALLKGVALIAGGFLTPGERFVRDVDILVPRGRLAEAVETLLDAGWQAERYGSLDEIFSLGFPRCHALGFGSPSNPDDEIDLHLSAVELNRFVASDAALWSHAVERKLFGLTALVPAAEHLLCICLMHSYLSDRPDALDWAIDATVLARREDFAWPLFFEESRRRGAEVLVRERIRKLVDLGAVSLPESAQRQLDRIAGEPAFIREFESLSSRKSQRHRAFRDVHAERARRILACGRPSEEKLPFPAPPGWLRTDVELPEGFPASGPPRKLHLSGRILHARARTPIRYRLYCGSVRLGAGRTLPIPAIGRGGFHAFRISAELEPAVVAAEGQAALSLYFGRRSRAAGVLSRESVVEITRLR